MKKENIVISFGFIACFLAAYRGMDFSPSFTMMFVVAGLGFCIAGEVLDMLQKKIAGYIGRVCFIIGMFWVFPAVIIYATGDDWMNGCMKAAGVGSVILCGVRCAWKWKKGETFREVCGQAVELLVSLAAALLAVFCGINSVALLPYGAGLLVMTASRRMKRKSLIREIIFLTGLLLATLFPVVPALGGIL